MKYFTIINRLMLIIVLAVSGIQSSASAQSTLSTVIPYQGQLTDGGSPANSQYDFEFKLFDAASAGNQIGATSTKDKVQVTNGLFAVELDFGGSAFNGAARFLAIGVRAGTSTGAFTALTPRRPLLAVPYALYSPSGSKPAYGMAANAPNNAAYVAANGNVGIGTTNPQGKLHVDGVMVVTGPDIYMGASGRGDGGRAFVHDTGDVLRINYGGEFSGGTSIGTGVGVFGPIHMSGPEFLIYPSTRGDGGRALMHDNGDVLRINYNGEFSGGTSIGTGVAVYGPLHMTGPDFVFLPTDRGDGGRAIVHDFNDTLVLNYGGDFSGAVRVDGLGLNVGGGLSVGGQLIMGNDFVMAANDRGDGGRAMVHLPNDTLVINYGGELTGGTSIESDAYIRGKLSVGSDASVRSLQIRGGADIAEPFDMSDSSKIEPGMVVTIDPDNPGQLRLANGAYDRMVAGVVSGAGGVNSGLIMQQEGSAADGEHPVALTGRVYVWVDASQTSVNPGDLLTTSDTPGHAMKVTDHTKAQGAILGKAMGTLEKGKGLVLMLVSLQ